MSIRSTRSIAALFLCSVVGNLGCWEQWSEAWFPQMKWQISVDPFEDVNFDGQHQGFSPPEGAVPIGGPPASAVSDFEALRNPYPSDLRSLENGRLQYQTYCAVCHGDTGLADGPVAKVFQGVLPLVGIARVRSDGHIFETISKGRRRMPAYARIPEGDRWDLINYVRYLDDRGGRP